ncbi:bifunctional diguanylate cyclase/phosphodiesterase [Eubacteriales bacterium OttesenSCG-928-A19]|nr:bifunctional diguanylate cyclase/phosphodiesterase [Eubacteriales bacterium OttesenSCG-928-A19]
MQKKKVLKKWWIYALTFVCLVGIWSLHLASTLRGVDENTRATMLDNASASQSHLSSVLLQQAQNIQLLVGAAMPAGDGLTPRVTLTTAMEALEDEDSIFLYYAALEDGQVFDADGRNIGLALDVATLLRVDIYGYALLNVGQTERLQMALVVRTSTAFQGYAIRVAPIERFTTFLRDALVFEPEQVVLFSASGVQLATLIEPEHPDDYQSAQSLQFEAMDFTTHAQEPGLNRTGMPPRYTFFIPLPQSPGWFLGGRESAGGTSGIYGNIFRDAFIELLLLLLLFAVLVLADTLHERRKQRSLLMERHVDMLSGLINAAGLEDYTERYLASTPSDETRCFVCMDIAMFHRFNTMFGYRIGDDLLRVIASVLSDTYACVGRVGGDIFAFIAPMEPGLTTQVEQKLRATIQKSLGREYLPLITFNFGIYPLHVRGVTFRAMYDGALMALRTAKLLPDQNEAVYDQDMQRQIATREAVEMNMLHALSREEFQIYVQPQFSATTEAFCGGEALVRWQSDQMGFLTPDEFIPIFEDNGFVVELDFYMLTSVLNVLQRIADDGDPLYPISVNQSRVTILFPNYLDRLRLLVKKFTVPLEYVRLEITESVIADDAAAVKRIVAEIKAMGFSIALDDFGVGYSSLNSLRDLPVDVLKIDRGFLKETDNSAKNQMIIKNIINMSKDLRIRVVCEGVETEQQLNFLRHLGADDIQGFYYAKPMPFAAYASQFFGVAGAKKAPARERVEEGDDGEE